MYVRLLLCCILLPFLYDLIIAMPARQAVYVPMCECACASLAQAKARTLCGVAEA